jgi:hypothetical protein
MLKNVLESMTLKVTNLVRSNQAGLKAKKIWKIRHAHARILKVTNIRITI